MPCLSMFVSLFFNLNLEEIPWNFTSFTRRFAGGRDAYINGRYVANATASKGAGRGRGRDPTGAQRRGTRTGHERLQKSKTM